MRGTLLPLGAVIAVAFIPSACASGGSGSSGGMSGSGRASGDGLSISIGSTTERDVTQLDRSQVPELGSIREAKLPTPDTFQLSNGIEVQFVRNGRVPLVGIEVLVRGGSSTLQPKESGLALLTAELLEEGAGSRGAFEFSERVEAIGGRLSSTASYDAFHIEASAPTTRLAQLIELVADATVRPRFADADVKRSIELQHVRVLQRVDDPADRADDAFQKAIFGADPYGEPLLGTPASLEGFDAASVRNLHREHFSPERTTLFVSGDTDREVIEPLLEASFGKWVGAGRLRALPEALTSTGSPPEIHVVDIPGAAQSEIRVGRVGTLPNDPAALTIEVLNTVLGGAFTSRLNAKLREEKGITYGASSHFTDNVRRGSFSAETAVDTPSTGEAVTDILAEFERLRTELVGEDELERAKRYLALRLPSLFETTSEVLDALSGLVLYSQPADWYDAYVEKVMSVTAEEVRAEANRFLNASEVVVVIAGDAERVVTELNSLGRDIVIRP